MDAFRHAYQQALALYGSFQTELLCAMNACNEDREFSVIDHHYRAAEDLKKKLEVLMPVVHDLYEKQQPTATARDNEKAKFMLHFLDRMPSASKSWFMDVYRCWLAEYELKNALRK